MSSIAIIPVKRFGRALRRLAQLLDRSERAAVQQAMLTDLLLACRACPDLDDALVVTNDPHAMRVVGEMGASAVPDHDPPRGMNAAVRIGQDAAVHRGADVGVVLTADLPLIHPDDLTALVRAAHPDRIVLSPSHDGTGTNALVMMPPNAINTQLGPDSRAIHHRAASAAGLRVDEHPSRRIGIDIDTPAELVILTDWPVETVTGRVCRELGIDRRLATVSGT